MNKINRILVAEDDNEIRELLRLYLTSNQYIVDFVNNGQDAINKINNEHFDLLLLDIMMPKMNGILVIEKLRQTSNIPIIVVSAKNKESDKILGLNMGADDYIEKPFQPMELIARINSNIRRYCYSSSNIITIRELTLNLNEITLKKNNELIELSPMEFKIIAKLMKSPNQVFTKLQIYEGVYNDYFDSNDNSIMVHISKIREKIEIDPKNPQYIKTIRGIGYKIEK